MLRNAEKLRKYRFKGDSVITMQAVLQYILILRGELFRFDEQLLLLLDLWKQGDSRMDVEARGALDHHILILWDSLYTR